MTLITILVNISLTVSAVAFLLLLLGTIFSLSDPESWEDNRMRVFKYVCGLTFLITPIIWTITTIAFIWTS